MAEENPDHQLTGAGNLGSGGSSFVRDSTTGLGDACDDRDVSTEEFNTPRGSYDFSCPERSSSPVVSPSAKRQRLSHSDKRSDAVIVNRSVSAADFSYQPGIC